MFVAVFGTGSIGLRHLRVLNGISGVTSVAVPKRPSRLSELKEQGHTVAAVLKDAVDMGVTHCVVATETGSHLEDGLMALECGLDVLMEKPLSTDAHQAKQLACRAESLGRKLSVACLLRFSESLGVFREKLALVGPLHNVRVESQSYLPSWQPGRHYQDSFRARPVEGGVLLDLIHDIDYPGWIFGWPDKLQGSLKNLGRLGIDAEEVADLNWEGPQWETVSIRLDFLSRPAHRSMTAYGESGTIRWDDTNGRVDLWIEGDSAKEFHSEQTRDEAFLEQAKQFLGLGQDSADDRATSANEGVKAMAVCDAVRRSSQSRQEDQVIYP